MDKEETEQFIKNLPTKACFKCSKNFYPDIVSPLKIDLQSWEICEACKTEFEHFFLNFLGVTNE